VVYVGDTEYDIIEARAAGVWAIGYAAGYRPYTALVTAGADHVIERLDVLPALLAALYVVVGSPPTSTRAQGPAGPGQGDACRKGRTQSG